MAGKKKLDQREPDKAGVPLSARFAVLMMFVSALVFLPTTIIFSVCMIPTMVAAIVDNHPHRTAWLTLGAMNLAGTVPVWLSLWDAGHTIPAAFQLIFQPSTYLLSYGGAIIGLTIFHNVTPLVASILVNKNERRLREIDRQQKALVKKWGGEIAAVEKTLLFSG